MAYEKAKKLLEEDAYLDIVATLEPVLEKFPARPKKTDYYNESDDFREILAASLNLYGISLGHQKRFKEAAQQYDVALRVGALSIVQSPSLNLIETCAFELKKYGRAIEAAQRFSPSTPSATFFYKKALAYAKLGAGKVEDADRLYRDVIELVKTDIEKLKLLNEDLDRSDLYTDFSENQHAVVATIKSLLVKEIS